MLHLWQGVLCNCESFGALAALLSGRRVHSPFGSWGSQVHSRPTQAQSKGMQSGLSIYNPFISWSTIRRGRWTRVRMLYQEDISYSLPWNPKSLVWRLLKGCMPKMKISRKPMRNYTSRAHELFCLEKGFLFKGNWLCIPRCGHRELLFQELHGGDWPGTLAWKRLVLCSKITTISRRCPRM